MDGQAVEVAARGRVMSEIDQSLGSAGVGTLRSGIEVRLEATVGLRSGSSLVQLTLLRVDPDFIAGRLAIDRDEILRKLKSDGSLVANSQLPMPLVPLRVGLVTSRGSAAHQDFLNSLARPDYRFNVKTVHAEMQGEMSTDRVVTALQRLAREDVDVAVVVRGGGSKLDLAAFDAESVARAVAGMPVPVITGIGHETDRSVTDEVAAIAEKTPTAAAEWLVARVGEFARRVDVARTSIRDLARESIEQTSLRLDRTAAQLAGTRGALRRQTDDLGYIALGVAEQSRNAVKRQDALLESFGELTSSLGLERTLKRGFALMTDEEGKAVRSTRSVAPGDRVAVQLADGKVWARVEEKE